MKTIALWSVARVAGAMRRGLAKRHFSLKTLRAMFAEGADRNCSAIALGLTVVTARGETYTDLSDDVIEIVNAAITDRIASTLENLEAIRIGFERRASQQTNEERWHQVRVINVTRVVNERGLDLTADEIEAAVVHYERAGAGDSVGITAHIEWAISQRKQTGQTYGEIVRAEFYLHNVVVQRDYFLPKAHEEALAEDAIREGTATIIIKG